MTTAYQSDAYQNNAYQIDVSTIEGFAFQECAFQADAFQADVCGVIPPEEVYGGVSGGILPRMHAKEKKRIHDDEDILMLLM